MAEMDFIALPQTITITVALEPAYNAISSLQLLTKAEDTSGLGDWIVQTTASMSPEQKHTHKLVVGPLFAAAVPFERDWPSFPACLDDIAA